MKNTLVPVHVKRVFIIRLKGANSSAQSRHKVSLQQGQEDNSSGKKYLVIVSSRSKHDGGSGLKLNSKNSAFDQELTQSQTADNPMAS